MKNKILIICFIGILFLPWLFSPISDRNLKNENRNITEFSFDNIAGYINDRLPFRSFVINVYQKADSHFEKTYQSLAVEIGKKKKTEEPKEVEIMPVVVFEETKEETKEHVHNYVLNKTSESSFLTYGYDEYACECGDKYRDNIVPKMVNTDYFPLIVNGSTIMGREDWLFYDVGMDYYTGANVLSEEEMQVLADKLNTLGELCKGKGISFYFMIMPDKQQVYSEYMPSYFFKDEYKRLQRMNDYMAENCEVPFVYPLEELKACDFYNQTYYKYDTHWNHYGAFVGLQTLYKKIGMEVTNPAYVSGELVNASLHDLISLGGLDKDAYAADYEYIVDYKPEVHTSYTEENDIRYYVSDCDNPQKLVMLADSYRLSMQDYIAKDFSESIILHKRDVEAVLDEIDKCDVLIISSVERDEVWAFDTVDYLIEYMKGEDK